MDGRLKTAPRAEAAKGRRLLAFTKCAKERFGSWSETTMLTMQKQAIEDYMKTAGLTEVTLNDLSNSPF